MNNRVYLVFIIILSCAILLVGGGLIGAALYLQGHAPVAAFPTSDASNALLNESTSAGGPQKGQPAPDFELKSPDGKTVRLSDFRGKPVMINFWASWCGPCTAEMKNIESVYQEHLNDDVVVLAVNQGEGDDTIKGYGELWKLNFRLLRDEGDKASRLYRIQALPTTVFVDADGNVNLVHVGGPMSLNFIHDQISALLEHK